MKTTTLTTRVDPEIKAAAEATVAPLGITLSQAVNIFLHRVIAEGGLPFDLRQPRYDKQVAAAMKEVDDILAHRVQAKTYASVDEMMDDLEDASKDE